MKKKPGAIRSTKAKTLSLRMRPEDKAALQAFADEIYEGNVSKAASDIILTVVCERHVLIFQRQLIAIAIHLNRFCHMLREDGILPELSELQNILEELENLQASFQAFSSG